MLFFVPYFFSSQLLVDNSKETHSNPKNPLKPTWLILIQRNPLKPDSYNDIDNDN